VDQAQTFRHDVADVSLMHGWAPVTVQVIAAVVLGCAIGWRSYRWRVRFVPVAAAAGVALALAVHWFLGSAGMAGDSAPPTLWLWVALSGLATGVAGWGWLSASWWRRGASMLAVPLCLLSAALVLNGWIGYFPTVHTVWSQLTSGPLPDQTDPATLTAMQLKGVRPANGAVVPVTISAASSKFKHRGELVYLPPVWFASNPPPRLPVLMMIGAELNTPADWVRAGNAAGATDDFAALHDGNAPVLVFVDSGGEFGIDTECVNGPRGNAADHLTKDVVPFMISKFGVSPERANWGVAGFSSGGTCAVDLAVMHPELFSVFEDIAGDLSPNSGNREQTVARLFGGNPDLWAAFDPTTVMTRHGPYTAVSGWFSIPGTPGVDGVTRDAVGNPEGQDIVAGSLCAIAAANGITCAVEAQPGSHDWPFAAKAFTAALPWLAGQLGTPGVPRIALPPPATSPPPVIGTVPALAEASLGN
jgi:S-formylglutathione hydrolase FrmB